MIKKGKVTITDVAEKVGVSIGIVSRVLNNDSTARVNKKTRAKIISTAKDMGYSANLFAAALRNDRTGIYGVICPNFAGTFLGLMVMELQREARRQGKELLHTLPEADSQGIVAQFERMQSMLFDGFLLLSDSSDYQDTIRRLQLIRKPYISIFTGLQSEGPLVNSDDVHAIRIAVKHLRGLGHRKIAFLYNPQWPSEMHYDRYFRQAMEECGLVVRPEMIIEIKGQRYQPQSFDFRESWTIKPLEQVKELFRRRERPTALVCSNDGFAIAVIKGLWQMGLRVPEDVSVIGYNDEVTSTLFYPELTTVRQPLAEISRAAMKILSDLAEKKDFDMEELKTIRHIVKPHLVERNSCAPPRSAE